jgi:hypothetical protein
VNVSGKMVFLMLFAVAVAFSVDPVLGALAFAAMFAATNRDAVVRAYHALDDAARRVERQLEQRGWLPGAVTTPSINKREEDVVTASAPAPAADAPPPAAVAPPTPAAVTTPPLIKREAGVVTLPHRLRCSTPPTRARRGTPFRWGATRAGASAGWTSVGMRCTSGCTEQADAAKIIFCGCGSRRC